MSLHALSGVETVVIRLVSGPMKTSNPSVCQYLIDADVSPVLHEQYQTVNMFQATLCQRWIGKTVSMRWRRSRYGKELQRVDLVVEVPA